MSVGASPLLLRRTRPCLPVLDPSAVDFSATGLVSLFIRHRLGPPPLAGTTERTLVQLADPALPPKEPAQRPPPGPQEPGGGI